MTPLASSTKPDTCLVNEMRPFRFLVLLRAFIYLRLSRNTNHEDFVFSEETFFQKVLLAFWGRLIAKYLPCNLSWEIGVEEKKSVA